MQFSLVLVLRTINGKEPQAQCPSYVRSYACPSYSISILSLFYSEDLSLQQKIQSVPMLPYIRPGIIRVYTYRTPEIKVTIYIGKFNIPK